MADIFVKLGDKANSFSDPISGVNLSGKEVIILTTENQKSKKTANALRGGHLVRASRSEYESYKKLNKASKPEIKVDSSNEDLLKRLKALEEKNSLLEAENNVLKLKKEDLGNSDDEDDDPDLLAQFEGMSDEDLLNYYTETYDVSEKNIKTFKGLTTEKKIEELIKLEKPE